MVGYRRFGFIRYPRRGTCRRRNVTLKSRLIFLRDPIRSRWAAVVVVVVVLLFFLLLSMVLKALIQVNRLEEDISLRSSKGNAYWSVHVPGKFASFRAANDARNYEIANSDTCGELIRCFIFFKSFFFFTSNIWLYERGQFVLFHCHPRSL